MYGRRVQRLNRLLVQAGGSSQSPAAHLHANKHTSRQKNCTWRAWSQPRSTSLLLVFSFLLEKGGYGLLQTARLVTKHRGSDGRRECCGGRRTVLGHQRWCGELSMAGPAQGAQAGAGAAPLTAAARVRPGLGAGRRSARERSTAVAEARGVRVISGARAQTAARAAEWQHGKGGARRALCRAARGPGWGKSSLAGQDADAAKHGHVVHRWA